MMKNVIPLSDLLATKSTQLHDGFKALAVRDDKNGLSLLLWV